MARKRLGCFPGARRVASSWPNSVRMAPFASACTSCTAWTCGKRATSRAAWDFDECSRTRAARRREDWMEVISEENELAADSNGGISSRSVSRVLENVESVEVRPVVVE